MTRLVLVALAAVTLAQSPVAFAGQVELTITEIQVAGKKVDGRVWDAMGGAPEIYAVIEAGALNGQRCEARIKLTTAKASDTYRTTPNVQGVFDIVDREVPCLVIQVLDIDMSEHDLVGTCALALERGTHAVKCGQATVTYRTERVAEPTAAAAAAAELGPPRRPRTGDGGVAAALGMALADLLASIVYRGDLDENQFF